MRIKVEEVIHLPQYEWIRQTATHREYLKPTGETKQVRVVSYREIIEPRPKDPR